MAQYNARLRRIEQHLPPDPKEWLQWINQQAIDKAPFVADLITEMEFICSLTPEGSDFRAPPGSPVPTKQQYLEAVERLHKTKGI
jgi:hypothetical protein